MCALLILRMKTKNCDRDLMTLQMPKDLKNLPRERNKIQFNIWFVYALNLFALVGLIQWECQFNIWFVYFFNLFAVWADSMGMLSVCVDVDS
jgi:hypothetical protein